MSQSDYATSRHFVANEAAALAEKEKAKRKPEQGQWTRGSGGQQFQQFASGRITREEFPMGGFIYFTTDNGKRLYSGNSYELAVAALPAA